MASLNLNIYESVKTIVYQHCHELLQNATSKTRYNEMQALINIEPNMSDLHKAYALLAVMGFFLEKEHPDRIEKMMSDVREIGIFQQDIEAFAYENQIKIIRYYEAIHTPENNTRARHNLNEFRHAVHYMNHDEPLYELFIKPLGKKARENEWVPDRWMDVVCVAASALNDGDANEHPLNPKMKEFCLAVLEADKTGDTEHMTQVGEQFKE